MPDSRRCQAWHHASATEGRRHHQNTTRRAVQDSKRWNCWHGCPSALLSRKTRVSLLPVGCCCFDVLSPFAFETTWNRTRGCQRLLTVDLQERCGGGGCGRGSSARDEYRRCCAVPEPLSPFGAPEGCGFLGILHRADGLSCSGNRSSVVMNFGPTGAPAH